MKPAILALEDGTVLEGQCRTTHSRIFGEIVFNTSMTGYTETFTDPSYAGQILLMTYPLIGNYGVYKSHYESTKVQIRGLVLKEPYFTAHRGIQLGRFLEHNALACIYNVDTRALTLRIRKHGTMKAMLLCGAGKVHRVKQLVHHLQTKPHPDAENLVARVSCKRIIKHNPQGSKRIVVIDCGVKTSILQMVSARAHVIQVPFDTSPDTIDRFRPDGILISNGPGDPAHPALQKTTIRTIKALINRYPLFGICLGHQLLGIALGLSTYKLKFGHRGSNHAVKNLMTGKVYITSQNHGYALKPTRTKVLHIEWVNVNDGTVEGFRHATLPIFSVQYHPEAAPGPYDTRFLFETFMEQL